MNYKYDILFNDRSVLFDPKDEETTKILSNAVVQKVLAASLANIKGQIFDDKTVIKIKSIVNQILRNYESVKFGEDDSNKDPYRLYKVIYKDSDLVLSSDYYSPSFIKPETKEWRKPMENKNTELKIEIEEPKKRVIDYDLL